MILNFSAILMVPKGRYINHSVLEKHLFEELRIIGLFPLVFFPLPVIINTFERTLGVIKKTGQKMFSPRTERVIEKRSGGCFVSREPPYPPPRLS
jgi:hypothetical protein